MTRYDDDREELPQGLIDDLRSADEPVPLITARVDSEVLRQAESQFSARKGSAWRRYRSWGAVAATVLVALFVVSLNAPPPPDLQDTYADHDGSGRVDIADVLYVARSTRQVKQSDIDDLAMRIVSLSPGEDSL